MNCYYTSVIKIFPTEDELLSNQVHLSCSVNGCVQTFPNVGALRMHVVKLHGIRQNEADKRLFHGTKSSDETIFQYHCPVTLCQYGKGAKKNFSSLRLVKQHFNKVHAERKFQCTQCSNMFVTEKDLHRHRQRCGVLYRCGSCSVPYTTKEALLTHCKRQGHTYPEEYTRQTKKPTPQKAKKKQDKLNPRQGEPNVTIITQPLLLVPVRTQESMQPKPVCRELKPKPVSTMVTANVIENQSMETEHVSHFSSSGRHDALIQTDIYGVDTLAVNKSDMTKNAHTKQKVTPKKLSPLKRKSSLSHDQNPTCPRRKKQQLTTGIQTSVSLTKKRGIPIVNSTQTTGDYIIEMALRHANIIEKKTVASQVTPNKGAKERGRWFKPKPVLVDFFSQVKEQHIEVETSHNYAESETMTDLPPSISTQTPQSYLINLYENENKSENNSLGELNRHDGRFVIDTIDRFTSNPAEFPSASADITSIADKIPRISNSVRIYSENFEESVSYEMPESLKPGLNVAVSRGHDPADTSPMYTAVPLDNLNAISKQSGITGESIVDVNCMNSTDSDVSVYNSSTVNGKNIQETGNMTDTEAQTMSGYEFNQLLQSSGIFLTSNDFMVSPNAKHTTVYQDLSPDSSQLANELDFLGTTTIDMNTQTHDLSLFDSFVPIDSNTQTGSEGLDFLDLVMTNMETQTLNDADLLSLGLLDSTLSNNIGGDSSQYHISGQSFEQGITGLPKETVSENSDVIGHSETKILPKRCGYTSNGSEQVITDNLTQNGLAHTSIQTSIELDRCGGILSADPDGSVKVQMETQTMSFGGVEPQAQTETQTQVELTDTDFVTINMETQTTFEDLQYWL